MKAQELRCSSCGRRIGFATSDMTLRLAVYCDAWCMDEPKTTPMEVRNDEWRALTTLGVSPIQVARAYDVAHPLVYRVIGRT